MAAVPLSFARGVSPGPRLGARDPEGRDALETLARDGVNLVRLPRIELRDLEDAAPGAGALPPSVQLAQDYLDWAERAGRAAGSPVVVAVNLGELSALDGSATRDRWLEYVVERFRDHPAMGVWKCLDEPNNPYTPDERERGIRLELERGYARVRELDPAHPVWVTFAPKPGRRATERYFRGYRRTADILAVDLYPISEPMGKHSGMRNRGPSAVGDYAARLANVARGCTAAGVPRWVWMVLQGAAFSGTLPRDEQRRAIGPCTLQPAAALVRYMTYQAIIHGAQGLLYFGMNVGLHPEAAPFGWDWGYWRGAVAPALRELTSPALAPALAAAGHPERARSGPAATGTYLAPRVDARTIAAPGGERVTLAARREHRPGELLEAPAKVSVASSGRADGAVQEAAEAAGGTDEVEVCFEGRSVALRGGALADTFLPLEVHVYRSGAGGAGRRSA